jgi:uncharacterized membrane-anchored protein
MIEHPLPRRRPELWRIGVWAAILLALGVTRFGLLRTAFTTNLDTTLVIVVVVLTFAAVIDGLWRRYASAFLQ